MKQHASNLSPVPPELIAFVPTDGADTRYGQLYKPLQDTAYKAAGIKGWLPPQPFKNLFANAEHDKFLCIPTVLEMNEELFYWAEGEQEEVMSAWDNNEEHQPLTSQVKRHLDTAIHAVKLPSVQNLHRTLISSRHCLFFIAFTLPGSEQREWNLPRVAYQASLSANQNCLHDGRFLVDFYILHPEDKTYNATNQQYWLEYHKQKSILQAEHAATYHLLRPSAESETYAKAKGLIPYRRWVYLSDAETYIHGPFDFEILADGRQFLDRIALQDWGILHANKDKFVNVAQSFDMLNLCSVHCTHWFHSEVESPIASAHTALSPSVTAQCYSDFICDESINE